MNTQPRIVAPHAPARFSTEEFVRICEVGLLQDIHLELVDGALERMTPPMGGHSSRQTALVIKLWSLVQDRAMVEAGIDAGEDTVLTCDVAVLRAPMTDKRFLRPEEIVLAIEIAETTIARDLGMKRTKYAGAKIADYWVVDSSRRVVHAHRDPVDGEYADVSTVRFGEPLTVPGTDATITIT